MEFETIPENEPVNLHGQISLEQYKYQDVTYMNSLSECSVRLNSILFDLTTPTRMELQLWLLYLDE